MITYFSLDDLITFGNFMISKERHEMHKKHLDITSLEKRLSNANSIDIQAFYGILAERSKQRDNQKASEPLIKV